MPKLNIGSIFDDMKEELLQELEKRVVVFLRRNLKPMVLKILLDHLDVDNDGNITINDLDVK